MSAPADIASAIAVSLEEMLNARERRAARQTAALARFGKPLVSVTVVTPGVVKDGELPRRVLIEALGALGATFGARQWRVLSRELLWQHTGPEALYVVDGDADLVKSATIELEDAHPIGRLWDLDVIVSGPRALSRKRLGFPVRRCLVCERPAFECGRSRRHPLPELWNSMQTMVNQYDLRVLA